MVWKTVAMVRQFWILGPMPKKPHLPTEKVAPMREILMSATFNSEMATSPLQLPMFESDSS